MNTRAWQGVAAVSKYPTRALPSQRHVDVEKSSRVLTMTTLVDDIWISGGVVYGEPNGHLYPDWRHNTDILLSAVASDICHLQVGPRFVAGDFNTEIGTVPAFDILFAAGFKDIQDLAAEHWGISPRPTCKGATRKDFLFISPELQSLLIGVHVADDIWPDHSVLSATFQRMTLAVPRQVWFEPSPFPWPEFAIDSQWWDIHYQDPSLQYARLWNHAICQSETPKTDRTVAFT